MPNWEKIKAEYISGDRNTSYRKLAKKYGVSLSAITRRSKSEKWADLRKQVERKANTKIVSSAVSKKSKAADKLYQIAEMLATKIQENIENGTYLVDAQSARQTVSAVKDLKEIIGIKSELDSKEQLARIEKLNREAQSGSVDKEIKVTISGDLEEYSK